MSTSITRPMLFGSAMASLSMLLLGYANNATLLVLIIFVAIDYVARMKEGINMSQDNTTAEQLVEAKLKEETGLDVKFSEFDKLTENRLKMAYKAFGRALTEVTRIETINNREDRRNPEKVDEIIEGVKSLKNSIMYALGYGIDNVVELPKFKNEHEATLAGVLAQLLDLRNLQLAANMRKDELTNKTGEENV